MSAVCVEVSVPVGLLRSGFSPRLTGENDEHIRMLADSDAVLPSILVHRPSMRVIDGMHRLRAAILRGDDTIAVEYFDGTEDDAFVLAVQRNVAHGLRLTLADRAAAVVRVLESHPTWSDRAIAGATGMSHKTVAAIRRRSTEDDARSNIRVGRDGRLRPLSAAEGRRRAGELIAAHPTASLRTIARQAGVSLGTARDVRQRLRQGQDPVPAKPRPATVSEEHNGHTLTVRQLRGDPSLRLNEAGRQLLRLLELHTMPAADWDRLADQVPTHLLSAASALSDECANAWRGFAERLARQQDARL